MRLSLIAAKSDNDVIGRDNGIPWHLPADLKHFKALTTDHTILIGRKTFESIGRPLPHRHSVVITRQPDFRCNGVTVIHSAVEAFERAKAGQLASPGGTAADDIFVAGGAEIYRLALPYADRIYLTRVHAVVDGDVSFPEFSVDDWHLESTERHTADDSNEFDFTCEVWDRREA